MRRNRQVEPEPKIDMTPMIDIVSLVSPRQLLAPGEAASGLQASAHALVSLLARLDGSSSS